MFERTGEMKLSSLGLLFLITAATMMLFGEFQPQSMATDKAAYNATYSE